MDTLGLGTIRQDGSDIGHQAIDGDRSFFQIELSSFDLREIKDVVDDVQKMLGRIVDSVKTFCLRGRHAFTAQDVGHADDTVHRSTDFVAHVGKKGTLGDAGGFSFFAGCRECLGSLHDPRFQQRFLLHQVLLVATALNDVPDVVAEQLHRFQLELVVSGCAVSHPGEHDDFAILDHRYRDKSHKLGMSVGQPLFFRIGCVVVADHRCALTYGIRPDAGAGHWVVAIECRLAVMGNGSLRPCHQFDCFLVVVYEVHERHWAACEVFRERQTALHEGLLIEFLGKSRQLKQCFGTLCLPQNQ